MSQSPVALGVVAMSRLSRTAQSWLVARFRLPWKNWLEGREERFRKLLSSSLVALILVKSD